MPPTLHVLLAVLLIALRFTTGAAAQEGPSGTSYLTPFPEGDTYKLQAYGDAFAEGLIEGLNEAFAGDRRIQVARKHRPLAGIARADFDSEMKTEEASREPLHIAVIMIGYGDRISIRQDARERFVLGSPEWREEYGRRVDRFIKILKRRNVGLYWVSQPIMRRYEVNDPTQMMNDIVRDKAYLNGIKFIDIQAQFADEAGNYSAYGPDLTGRQRLLREADGMGFTFAGNRKLALFVEQEIKRDLSQARKERSIPLAGSESEQDRISALRPRPPAEPETAGGGKTGAGNAPEAKAAAASGASTTGPAMDGALDQKADNGRITLKSISAAGREESFTLDLPRPAIPSAVVALVTRNQSSERPASMGDVVADEIGGGLVVLSSITPATSGSGLNRRQAPSQAPYYHVLIKGERLPTKPGRADDFGWPRVEPDIPEPEPVRRARPNPPKAAAPPRS
ncbi:MAG TPA: DUF459 domain-containing protein [Hyphomicrobiaceae bacterium]|jgi:uncharacterized protein|nr:DUF459 domain-containing protein [Hyphomicrobiaceae bacterium]